MGTFVTQQATPDLFATKVPAPGAVIPPGLTAANVVQAADMNALEGALLDARDAIRGLAVPVRPSDAQTVIQAALNQGGPVHFEKGTYSLPGTAGLTVSVSDTHITAAPGAKLVAPNLTYGSATHGAALFISGTRTADVTVVAVDIVRNDLSFTVASAAGLAVGQLLVLRSVNESFNDERTVGVDGFGYHKGEHVVVAGLAGNVVTAAEPLKDSYSAALDVRVDVLTPVERVTVQGLGVDCQQPTGNGQFGIFAQYFRDVLLDGCQVTQAGYAGVYFNCGVNGLLADSVVTECRNSTLGYGVYFFSTTGGAAYGCAFRNVRHGFDVSGQNNEGFTISRGVSCVNNTVQNSIRAGISTHGGAEHILIAHTRVSGTLDGIICRSPHTAILDNKVWAVQGTGGIDATAGIVVGEALDYTTGRSGEGVRVERNDVYDCPTNGIYVRVPLSVAIIRGNRLRRLGIRRGSSSPAGILLRGASISDTRVEDNDVDIADATSVYGGIIVDPGAYVDGSNQRRLVIRGNDVKLGPGGARLGVYIKGNPAATPANLSRDVVVEGNAFDAGGTHVRWDGFFERSSVTDNRHVGAATTNVDASLATGVTVGRPGEFTTFTAADVDIVTAGEASMTLRDSTMLAGEMWHFGRVTTDATGSRARVIHGKSGGGETVVTEFRNDDSVNFNQGLRVGGGPRILTHLTGSASWTPGAVAGGATVSTTVTVNTAAVGDMAIVSYVGLTVDGWLLTAYVESANTARVRLTNQTGGSLNPGTGTVRVSAFRI